MAKNLKLGAGEDGETALDDLSALRVECPGALERVIARRQQAHRHIDFQRPAAIDQMNAPSKGRAIIHHSDRPTWLASAWVEASKV